MALKKCNKCGAEVSSAARTRPKSGTPALASTLQNLGCSLMLIPIIIIKLIFVLVAIS